MTKKEYIEWEINNIKNETRNFMTAHYPELKCYYAELIDSSEMALVDLGFTWEEVEQISISVMKEFT